MNGPLAMIFVILVIVLGIGAAWGITAHGAATAPLKDSFGNVANGSIPNQTAPAANLAVSTMPILPIVFILAVCVVLVIVVLWFWSRGKYGKSEY